MISKFARLPEPSIWKTEDPAVAIVPYVLRNELIESLALLRKERFSDTAENKIQELLTRGANIQDPEWYEIHWLCSSKTIKIAHRVLNSSRHCGYFCELDYVEKAAHQKDPQNLLVLKKALGHEKSSKIVCRLTNVSYVDLDTLMLALKKGVSDKVVEALYKKFRSAPFFEVCNKNCLANHIFKIEKNWKLRDSNLVLTILRDVSNIRSGSYEMRTKPGPLYQALHFGYPDEIIKAIIGKIENFDFEMALELLYSGKISRGVLAAIEPILGARIFSSQVHYSISSKKEETWILNLLEFADNIPIETLGYAAKQGYSTNLITALANKTPEFVLNPFNIEFNPLLESLTKGYYPSVRQFLPKCHTLYLGEVLRFATAGMPIEDFSKLNYQNFFSLDKTKHPASEVFQAPYIYENRYMYGNLLKNSTSSELLNLTKCLEVVPDNLIYDAMNLRKSEEVILAMLKKCQYVENYMLHVAYKNKYNEAANYLKPLCLNYSPYGYGFF